MPFRPALERFGLEDRCRERGPKIGFGFRVPGFAFQVANSKIQVGPFNLRPETRNLKLNMWSGREADPPLHSTTRAVTVLPG